MALHRLHAAFLPDNIASRRVLEKNGFREEGYAENYLQIDGAGVTTCSCGLTRERYDGQRVQPVSRLTLVHCFVAAPTWPL